MGSWCSRKLEESGTPTSGRRLTECLGAGVDREKTALLCVVGAREDGVKELLGMELGYREGLDLTHSTTGSDALRSVPGVVRKASETSVSSDLIEA